MGDLMNPLLLAILIFAIILLVVGLYKKTLWMCVVAIVLGAVLYVGQPDNFAQISSAVSSFFGGAVDPFEDDDYSDLIDDEIEDTPNRGYDEIGDVD